MIERKTRKHMEAAFLEVSRAAARKKLYALRAEHDGHKQLAKLFRAMVIIGRCSSSTIPDPVVWPNRKE